MSERFSDQVALITGGSKGIGRAIALRLAAEGAAVAFTWFRDKPAAEKTLIELEELGARAMMSQAFLGDEDAPERLVEEVTQQLGTPSFLVSNAATGVQRPLAQLKRAHWDWTMDTNARAFLGLIQSNPDWRSILAISSMGSSHVLPLYGLVGASKAVVETLVRYAAVELAPRCRVNTILAGVVDTDSLRKFPHAAALLEEALKTTPMGRLVSPEDVADVAALLLSDDARMITGQTIVVDGGYSLVG